MYILCLIEIREGKGKSLLKSLFSALKCDSNDRKDIICINMQEFYQDREKAPKAKRRKLLRGLTGFALPWHYWITRSVCSSRLSVILMRVSLSCHTFSLSPFSTSVQCLVICLHLQVTWPIQFASTLCPHA